jgi:hypothetical protein
LAVTFGWLAIRSGWRERNLKEVLSAQRRYDAARKPIAA